MSALDLKKFKKIKTDGKVSIFRHEDGHEIRIAHGKLEKPLQKQLSELPHYDDGGEVEPDRAPAGYDEDLAAYNQGSPGSHAPSQEEMASEAQKYEAKPIPEEQKSEPAPPAQQSAESDSGPGPANMPQQQSPQGPGMMGNYAKAYLGGVEEQKKGIKGTAEVTESAQKNIANLLQSQAGFTGLHTNVTQQVQDKVLAGRDALKQHLLENPVDHNRIFKDKSVGDKIGTFISLMLGGIGSGLTGGPNLAYDYMMKQRDADIAEQEKNLDTYKGLYYHNFQDFKDRTDARLMSQTQMNDAMSMRIQAAAASSNSANAKNIALGATGLLDRESAMLTAQIGRNSGNNIGDTLQMMRFANPQMAKSMEERYVPSLNQIAPIPVPEADRQKITMRQDLENKIQELRSFAQQNTGTINPAKVNEGKALVGQVQDLYRQANGQGVFKESEKEFVNSIIHEDPTAFFNKYRVDPGYRSLLEGNRESLHNLYRNYGLTPPAGGGFQSSGIKSFRPKK